jgi:hypothetical protein
MPICSSEICLCVSAYGGRGLIRGRRDDDCYERSAFFTALDLQGAAAHQMQALTYIVQTDMFLADLLLRIKSRAVILNRNAGNRALRPA